MLRFVMYGLGVDSECQGPVLAFRNCNPSPRWESLEQFRKIGDCGSQGFLPLRPTRLRQKPHLTVIMLPIAGRLEGRSSLIRRPAVMQLAQRSVQIQFLL